MQRLILHAQCTNQIHFLTAKSTEFVNQCIISTTYRVYTQKIK